MVTLLSIIILNYNTKKLTIKCLESIVFHYGKQLEKGEFEIIVVDNASTDGSVEAISNFQFPISNFQLIKNDKNFGFSKGCNIGAAAATGKILLFLNSDAYVQNDSLIGMVSYLQKNQEVAIVGGKLLNGDKTAQRSAGKFYSLPVVFTMLCVGERFGFFRKSPTIICDVNWVSGGCMMIKKNIFDKLKGFDEHFFMYMEDMELCFRAKKAGYKVVFYPNFQVVHEGHKSSSRSSAIIYIYKGLNYFYKKHKTVLEYAILTLLLLGKAYIAIAIGSLTGNGYLTSTYKKAIAFSL